VQRDDHSWLIDGVTPMEDVKLALGLHELPYEGEYDSLARFLMVMRQPAPPPVA
jgi:CBS domain containing-hemolysin-like protein